MQHFPRPRLLATVAALLVAMAFSGNVAAQGGPLDCTLTFSMEGWSAFYKTAEGEGIVSCSNGQRLPVRISSRGGGITFGKSRIDKGRGEFSGIVGGEMKIEKLIDELAGSIVNNCVNGLVVYSNKAKDDRMQIIKAFAHKDERIAELEAQIERLKCCGNCKHEPEFFSDNGCCVMCAKLDKWEAK